MENQKNIPNNQDTRNTNSNDEQLMNEQKVTINNSVYQREGNMNNGRIGGNFDQEIEFSTNRNESTRNQS